MNLWFRLLKVLLFSARRPRVEPVGPSEIDFRVWPVDLDVFRHMNNGRYLTLMDLGRVDLMMRAGLYQELQRAGYYPVVVEEMIRFRKSLAPFEKFTLRTRVLAWDEKYFYLRQDFLTRKKGTAATGYIKARFLKRVGGTVQPQEVLSMISRENEPQPRPEIVKDWATLSPYFDEM